MIDIPSALFFVFAAILLFASLRVVTAKNPVHAVLYLVLAFFQASGLWMLLHAEFLSIALVLVYVGAVMVLFLFVVMMLDIDIEALRAGFWRYFPLAVLLAAVVALEIGGVVWLGFSKAVAVSTPEISNTQSLGTLLYTQYVYPVQIAAVILLVAMVAAIALVLRHRKDSKHIAVSEQVKVKAKDRLKIVSGDLSS